MVSVRLGNFLSSGLRIVFTMPLPNRDPVFMKQETGPLERGKYGIVHVDSTRFLQRWRHKFADGTPDTWRRDRKYDKAVEGFSRGAADPVPLAYAIHKRYPCRESPRRRTRSESTTRDQDAGYILLDGGITRTIWLLAQGCVSFPVKCDLSEAQDVQRAVGVPGAKVRSVAELADSLPAPMPDVFDDADRWRSDSD